jgi:NDP-sugar pyrophosphorylase family protein
MAGGQGKRLMPLTESRPKPMVDIGGKPLLEIILERCIAAGFRDFYISVNYLKHHIIDHFEDGSKWNVSIRYLEELEPLGTAGPLRLLPERPDVAVLVMNGDVLSSLDLAGLLRFHGDNEASATMCVRTHETQIPFGVVRSQGIHLESFDEKPVLTHFVNAGIYVIAPEILDLIPEGRRYDMPDLLVGAQNVNLPVAVFPIHEYWIDVGNHRALAQANADLL